jgi:glutathione S-transferase
MNPDGGADMGGIFTMEQQEVRAFTLVSHHLCPYAQRAAIVLAEKGIPFEQRDIDLANKPDWFHAISPLGKVPLLLVRRDGGEAAIFESAVICEYLEESHPGARLHPADPLERARHRGWAEFGSSILLDLWGFETAADAGRYEIQRQMLISKFARVEAALNTVPYFAGASFSIVDAAYAPIFRYFDVFDAIADTEVFARVPKLRAWRAALAARPSVAKAAPADYAGQLRAFLAKRDAYLLKMVRKPR